MRSRVPPSQQQQQRSTADVVLLLLLQRSRGLSRRTEITIQLRFLIEIYVAQNDILR